MNETPHSKFIHLYAIVRIDLPVNQQQPDNSIAVIKVFSSKDVAKREASRLTGINEKKECRYVVYTTRLGG